MHSYHRGGTIGFFGGMMGFVTPPAGTGFRGVDAPTLLPGVSLGTGLGAEIQSINWVNCIHPQSTC